MHALRRRTSVGGGNLLLTVSVEDYFHGKAFAGVIDERQWPRFEARVEKNTLASLELLRRTGSQATFFFLDWVAGRHPDLVREVIRQGHEVACGANSNRGFRHLSSREFSEEAARSKDILENAAGIAINGFRAADHHLTPKDMWALRVLSERGFLYDSSVNPWAMAFRKEPWRRFIHQEVFGGRRLWEVPMSSVEALGFHVPVAGGNWFRQLPETAIRRAVKSWSEAGSSPFVMYFRVWDLDADQPVITGAPALSRLRHYRNPERVPALIESFLEQYPASSIGVYLGLEQAPVATAPRIAPETIDIQRRPSQAPRTPVTVVIPCYNEQAALPYLSNTLRGLRTAASAYDLHFLFVDDGSSDGTYDALRGLFGAMEGCQVIKHDRNRGVAAAIMTGIRNASTDIVCSMDCDCTYDPHGLIEMIPLLEAGVDMVTASPYHPRGKVERVPGWRLCLSRGASFLYRMTLRQRLYTYTSCFRVYRRSAILPIRIKESGFLGVAELLGKLDLAGGRIVEYPATLHVRMLGRSKMKVLRTIGGHVGLIARFASERLTTRHRTNARSSAEFCSTALAPKGMDRD